MNALLSIDVEDWFQVENLKACISRNSWGLQEGRIHRNIDLILHILRKNQTHCTFFVLGWIAKRYPDLVRKIHREGHEIASHGYGHELIYTLPRGRFQEDVKASKEILESIIGESVIGYRAPSFSITDEAIDVLQKLGFRYDSSLFPAVHHDRYGKLDRYEASIPAPCYHLRDDFFLVLLSSLSLLGMNVPWGGGGYFRLIPYPVFKRGVARILEKKSIYCFYIHPWEFDKAQPRLSGVKRSYRFRHYNNLSKTCDRFSSLVQDFRFERIRNILPG